MKLKKGMYVKYTRGMTNGYVPPRIAKIVDCSDNDLVAISNSQVILKSDVIKASENIIDLITENDLLEIKYLIRSYKHQVEVLEVIKNYEGRLYVNAFPRRIFIEDFKSYRVEIISIVTKEQFETMKYIIEK